MKDYSAGSPNVRILARNNIHQNEAHLQCTGRTYFTARLTYYATQYNLTQDETFKLAIQL